jgi:hypothetical protein
MRTVPQMQTKQVTVLSEQEERQMSNYKKLHITLVPASYQAIRKYAFDEEVTLSEAIDYLVQRCLIQKMLLDESAETAVPPQAKQHVEAPNLVSESVPMAWSVTSLRHR